MVIKNKDLALSLIRLCEARGLRLALAESCTGGAMAACLTSVAGASKVFAGSVVSYQDHVKSDVLHVPREMLQVYGAVSEPVARKMLEGCLELMSADVGIAVTGLAGPGGGSPELSVGTVWLAVGFRDQEPKVCQLRLKGERSEIIEEAIRRGLTSIIEQIA